MPNFADTYQTNSRSTGNPGAWNPGSDGHTWASQGGNYTLGLTGSSPHIFGTLTGLTTRVTEYYSSASQADGVISVKFKVSNSSDGVGLVFRGDGTNANEYRCFYRGGNNTLEIAKVVSTTVTTLVSTSFTATAGTLYDIKCSFVGTTLQGKIWKDTDSEPGYQVSTTDATYATGQFGMQIAAGANTDTVSVQYFSLIDSAVTKTRTISATASLTPTISRGVLVTAALQGTLLKRTMSATAALQLTKTRTISATAALLWTPLGSSYAATTLGALPIRYYRLNEGSGTVVHDLGSQGQNGTVNGGVTLNQPGLIANDGDTAMLFSGGYISLPTAGLPTGAHPWSVECWVKVPILPTSAYEIFHIGTFGGAGNAGVRVTIDNTPHLIVASADFGLYFGSGFLLVAGEIYHGVVTYDGTTVTIYVNGAFYDSASYTFALGSSLAYLGIDEFGNALAGTMDEPAFFDDALSVAQVSALWSAGSTAVVGLYVPAAASLDFAAGTRGISATAALQFVFAHTLPASGALLATASRTISATAALSAQRTIPADASLTGVATRTIPADASLALYIALFPQTARRTGLFPTSARRGVSS